LTKLVNKMIEAIMMTLVILAAAFALELWWLAEA
jgi:hypothetical protein